MASGGSKRVSESSNSEKPKSEEKKNKEEKPFRRKCDIWATSGRNAEAWVGAEFGIALAAHILLKFRAWENSAIAIVEHISVRVSAGHITHWSREEKVCPYAPPDRSQRP